MAKFNLQFYNNETNYTDGEIIEDKILDFVVNNKHNDLNGQNNIDWPLFYHLSHLRENILNWYPFKENCRILEVGAGCGAITRLLCEKANYVASVELTYKRANINFERHKEIENLEIFVGNFENMRFDEKFDYVIVNGVLEYAGGFINSDKPYEDFVRGLSKHLKNDGEVIIAIENRIGMKYFSGAKEDHLGELFVGLNDYVNEKNIRTFSKSEISFLLEESGLALKKFYYPYPDYKFPETIYSDEGFELIPLSYDTHSYDTDRYMFFDEIKMQSVLVKESVGSSFANSFLIVAGKNDEQRESEQEAFTEEILYVKINANRDDSYKIFTMIKKNDRGLAVVKHPLTKKAKEHLKHMAHVFENSKEHNNNISLLPGYIVDDDLVFDFLDLPTVETLLLEKLENRDLQDFMSIINKFRNIIITQNYQVNSYSDKFQQIFGPEVYDGELEFTSYSNIDTLFDNMFYNNEQWIVIDYEWNLDCDLPVNFILWRSIKEFYAKHRHVRFFMEENGVYENYGITPEMINVFYKWEGFFSSVYVKMLNKEIYQKNIITLLDPEQVFKSENLIANLYLDTGDGFNDYEKIQQHFDKNLKEIVLEFDISEYKNIKAIRFDPLEGHACKCSILSSMMDGESVLLKPFNSYSDDSDVDFFITTDPIYLMDNLPPNILKLHLRMKIEVLDEEQAFKEINEKIHQMKEMQEQFQYEIDEIKTENNKLANELKKTLKDKGLLAVERENLLVIKRELSDNNNRLNNEISLLNDQISRLMHEKSILAQEYTTLVTSKIWKSTKPVRLILDSVKNLNKKFVNLIRECFKLILKTKQNLKTIGLTNTIKKIYNKGPESLANVKESGKLAEIVQEHDIWREITQWIENTPHSFVDIFHVPMGWNTPLFQRFQHLSLQAGNVGGISFYGAHPLVDKEIEICEFVTPTLCVINLDNYEIKKKLFEILDNVGGLKIIRLQSIDLATRIEELESFINKGYHIVYEYIDEITPQITGNIPKFVLERHDYILQNSEISIVATADKLFDQIKPYRNQNMELITNGVDYEHWNLNRHAAKCPEDIREIVELGKIVVGYHGALAQWIDYNMLKDLAENKEYVLLLIGYEHDGSLRESGLLDYDNVHFIGSKPYAQLSNYAVFYDIAILPFLLNDITKSVSPVKIFEYMALKKPIVTYALPECLKYESCLIAYSPAEFIEYVEKATTLRMDTTYLTVLTKEALENTWTSITQRTVDLVRRNPIEKVLNNSNHNELSELDVPLSVTAHDRRIYQVLKKVFWRLPLFSPRFKKNFLYNTKKLFKPSLLAHPPSEIQEENGQVMHKEIEGAQKEQIQYIEQILKIPERDKEAFVALTESHYSRVEGDSKIIAYYLTQFHPDEHNEKWWGKGVTEWDNVARAVPQFVGHYQPRLPGELGFYDLRIKENMARQIELAQMHGVFGFSFYYYWFNGERLLEKPIEMFLEDKSLDFPFSLCWANENWTKRFDGTNSGILMEQPKTLESYKNVIHDMVRFLDDSRYITVKGKKMITVYRPGLMPEPDEIIRYWREYCHNQGIGELYIIAVKENMVELDLLGMGFDAISEFHPGTVYTQLKNITHDIEYIRKDFSGEVFDYKDLVEKQKYFNYDLPKLYRAVMPMWDNTARRNNKGMIFQGATPALYKQWLKDVILEGKSRSDLDDQLVFVNAWNEWGEGAYLEPDKKYGYAYLQATKEAVEETR
ncbi:glycoside hydrolase family 99-like domain-containing protein [Paenibacillus sp. FSL R7-0204]|uniref:glycoside hydrolase family 99-like domain-containing protein n=1 Tax=Paenibacillus sp. FSL R7-0204 TaxID=2921675 RepID=UPI0030FBC66C